MHRNSCQWQPQWRQLAQRSRGTMSAHTHRRRHTDTLPHTVTHTDRHTYIDRQHKRLLLICCICYGAHLLASSSMCVLSTEYICMCVLVRVCLCGPCVCVQQLHLYATYAVTIGLNVSLTRLASATWALSAGHWPGCPQQAPAPCHLCPRCPALYTAWRPLASGTVF